MWQQLVDDTGLDLVSVSIDVQGPEVVRPWTEAAAASFTTLVDSEAQLAGRLGVTAVPFVLTFENRRLVRPVTSINVLEDHQAEAVRHWALGAAARIELTAMPERHKSQATELASAWLTVARLAIEEERLDDAGAALARGFELDPDNWLIRKQRWALSEPDRFYAGKIDQDWQKEQRAAGR
ncbi:MAG: hypothetical protein WD638_02890 [Nitriliruptoraceae bacterium]